MDEILGRLYCWFESFFGQELADHLWGYSCETQSYSNQNKFITIGLITLLITGLFIILFYYIVDHPRFNKWWHWLIVLAINGVVNLFIGYGITYSDLLNGAISDCLVYARDENGNIIQNLILHSHCWGFGIANFIVSILFFIILTLIFKWRSRNCRRSPF